MLQVAKFQLLFYLSSNMHKIVLFSIKVEKLMNIDFKLFFLNMGQNNLLRFSHLIKSKLWAKYSFVEVIYMRTVFLSVEQIPISTLYLVKLQGCTQYEFIFRIFCRVPKMCDKLSHVSESHVMILKKNIDLSFAIRIDSCKQRLVLTTQF